MAKPRIYADFQNADILGRVRLNCVGTIEDLARQGIKLHEGLQVIVHDDELEADGEAQYSLEERVWGVKIDWQAIRSKDVAAAVEPRRS
jgi:hypothetical protein